MMEQKLLVLGACARERGKIIKGAQYPGRKRGHRRCRPTGRNRAKVETSPRASASLWSASPHCMPSILKNAAHPGSPVTSRWLCLADVTLQSQIRGREVKFGTEFDRVGKGAGMEFVRTAAMASSCTELPKPTK
jgi:hypothetical protein